MKKLGHLQLVDDPTPGYCPVYVTWGIYVYNPDKSRTRKKPGQCFRWIGVLDYQIRIAHRSTGPVLGHVRKGVRLCWGHARAYDGMLGMGKHDKAASARMRGRTNFQRVRKKPAPKQEPEQKKEETANVDDSSAG